MAFGLSFGCDLEHYLNDESPEERALDRIRPRDPGLYRVIVYDTATALKRFPITIETRPLDMLTSPEEAEDARRAIERKVFDRRLRYKSCRRRMVVGSQAAGVWGTALEYDARLGLRFTTLDPRDVTWDTAYLDPQDPCNPRMFRVARLRPAEVEARFKLPKGSVRPDNGLMLRQQSTRDSETFGTGAARQTSGPSDFVTIVFAYSRFEKEQKVARESGPAMLDPMQRYMACAACGWKSPMQGEAPAPVEFPDTVPLGCPTCMGDIHRVDALPRMVDGVKYKGGKRLVICGPFSQPGTEKPWYDGDWEFDYDFFPLHLLIKFPPPHRPYGQSTSAVLKSPLLAKNGMFRLTYETLIRSKPYWKMPEEGVKSVYGRRFAFRPGDGDIMLGNAQSLAQVDRIPGVGVDGSIFKMMEAADSVFRTNEANSQLALSPSQVAEATASSLAQYTESGNVPTDDFGDLLYDVESELFSNVAAALREMPSEMTRYQTPSGDWAFRRAGGPAMPQVEVVVGAGNQLEILDNDEVRSFMLLRQMSFEEREAFAAIKHIDPSILKRLPPPPMAMPGIPGAAPMPQPMAPTNGVPSV